MCCNSNKKGASSIHELVAEPQKQSIKIALIGDVSVGKTTLGMRFAGCEFAPTASTIAIDVLRTEMQFDNGTIIPICIWDTAGQERFGSVVRASLRGSTAVVLVYSMASRASLQRLIYTWYPLVKEVTPGFQEMLLVGNKSDLETDPEGMDDQLATFCELLKEDKVRFMSVKLSAATSTQRECEGLFEAFVRRITFPNPELYDFVDLSPT